MRILAIGVHPDDIEFGMGASLAKHIDLGHEIEAMILTDGARDELGFYTQSDERREETLKALRILGFKNEPIFLNLQKVKVNQSTIKPIEDKIKEFNPDRIYSHSNHDRHQDHRRCMYSVMSAARYVNEILLFEMYSGLPEFNPRYFIHVTDKHIELKGKALACHSSQFKDMELIKKMIEGMALKHSIMNHAFKIDGIHYAEAFEIAKIIKRNSEV